MVYSLPCKIAFDAPYSSHEIKPTPLNQGESCHWTMKIDL